MYIFITPSMIKKDADTAVPMMLPTRVKPSNLRCIAAALAATTKDVIMTILSNYKLEPV
jgi:hypothetical protein